MPHSSSPLPSDCEAIRAATRKLVREFDFFRNIRPVHTLNLSQTHALIEIQKQGTLTLGDLTDILGLNKSSISRLLQSLEKAKLIQRVPHPADSRVKPYALSPAGVAALAEIDADTNARVERALARLKQGEAPQIAAAMLSYATALRATRHDDHART